MNKRTKNIIVTLILTFVLSITTVPTLITQPQVSATVNDPTFSIMQISDTQNLAFLNPTLYNDTTSWIVNNSAGYNLKMVIDTGDFVNSFITPPLTIYNSTQIAQEWVVANAAMSKLLNAGIPYTWCAGNHDQIPYANPNGTSMAINYSSFNTTEMAQKSYWVDDLYDAKNTAVKFTYNYYPFMIINIEYLANASTLAWMKGLLDKNLGVNSIVATHGYLDSNGTYDASTAATGVWTRNLKSTLDSYPNVFLALCGHNRGAKMTMSGNRPEIMFNFQDENNKTGAASVRIYTFNLDSKKVYASTYCIENKTWLTDAYNQFSFDANLISANPYTDPTAVAWNVDASFNFTDMLRANHTYVPVDKVANPVQKLTISYDEKMLTCDIKVGGVTYSLDKDFSYKGHTETIFYNPSFANPTLGYLYPSGFSGDETAVNYMYNFSAVPGGLEGTLSMLATMKNGVSSIVSVAGTGDFRNVQVKATNSPSWYDASKLVVNIYHDGMVSGWPHAVPTFMTTNTAVTYAQLTDYCTNVWGLASNPYPAFSANNIKEYGIFNFVIGDKFYLGVSCGYLTSGVPNPVTKALVLTYNTTWYLGDWYKGVAKMDQGFTGTAVLTLFNYKPANATATPPTQETYDVGPAVWNLQGFGALSGQSVIVRADGPVLPYMAKGYAMLP